MTAENTANPAAPNTIALIHGLWMTPLSWEQVADYALTWAIENAAVRQQPAST